LIRRRRDPVLKVGDAWKGSVLKCKANSDQKRGSPREKVKFYPYNNQKRGDKAIGKGGKEKVSHIGEKGNTTSNGNFRK